MQIPIMAIDVFMGRFIAAGTVSVKAESAARRSKLLHEGTTRTGFRKVLRILTKWP